MDFVEIGIVDAAARFAERDRGKRKKQRECQVAALDGDAGGNFLCREQRRDEHSIHRGIEKVRADDDDRPKLISVEPVADLSWSH